MSLPTPTFIGQEATVAGKRYQAVSLDPEAWKNITTGTHGLRLDSLEELSNTVLVDDQVGYAEYPADCSTAVLNAYIIAAASGKKVGFLGKPYKFSVSTTDAVSVVCSQGFLAEPPSASAVSVLKYSGVASENKYQLSAPIERGTLVLNMTTGVTDIVAGDYIVIQDDSRRQSDNAGEINMEVHKVKAVAGSQVTLHDFVRAPKAVYSENVYKISMLSGVTVEGFNYKAAAGSTNNIGILYDMCSDITTNNLRARGGASDAVSYRRCYNVRTTDWDVAEPQNTTSGQGYGIAHLKGTRYIHVGAGVANGMRHAVDFDSCYDVTSDVFRDEDSKSGGVLLAHNGYGGDFLDFKFVSQGAFQSCYIPQNSVLGADAYTKPAHNINVKVWSTLPLSSGAYGFYSEQALIDSDIVVHATHGDGGKPTTFVSNTASCRIPASDCANTKIHINTKGAVVPFSRIGAAGSTSVKDAKVSITGSNMYHLALIQNSPVVDLDVDVSNVHAVALSYSGVNTLRRLRVSGDTSSLNSDFTDIVSSESSTSGCVGKVSLYDSDSDLTLTLTNGANLTQDQILKALDGEFLRVTAASAISLNSTRPILGGLYTGQRLTITHDQTTNTITIPNTANCQNFGGSSVVLGTSKRSVTYSFDASLDRWYQIS